ncbi:D-xylulose kinase [Beauveria brongniartii RCEF 3172]|uniref:Xylulose kinase n=1 Tax=Beauveria brongniartii RCEF 3172 TaxID=1081107 RepID=A0A166YNH6_9HYPO|nr:D-xylulose kinase [Beauveria brongniartii RCEF 3172]
MAADDDGPLYLGFDLSTQQLKAIVVGSDLQTVARAHVDFDADFAPAYGITKGVHVRPSTGQVYAPVALWLDSLDLVLARLVTAATPRRMARIRGDQSTQDECDAFDAALGGREELAKVTGSGAHHRFTGPQIMRLRRTHPQVYENTARISLVSSWLASVLLGRIAPLDVGDALGPIAGYFAARYGFDPRCQVLPFTGDNPATILALPLRPGDAIVSLGTSTTFLMHTETCAPDGAYHFFNHPTTPGHYMFMLCYKNGGLSRERVRDALPQPDTAGDGGDTSWQAFDKAVVDTPPLGISSPDDDDDDNDDESRRAKMGLYFDLRETVPNIRPGTWRFTCNAADGSDLREEKHPGPAWSAATDARLIVESQALSMRLRSQKLVRAPSDDEQQQQRQLPAQPRRIYLVGGASHNAAIAQTLGSVLGGLDGVYRLDVGGDACALGGAYKAMWALQRREGEAFDELLAGRWREEGAIVRVDRGYREETYESYGNVLGAFEEMEQRLLAEEKK